MEGFTEPFRRVELSPSEPGILKELFVQEGIAVKPGDKLAVLDTQVLEINRKIAQQAMRSNGRLNAAKAERDLRAKRLTKLQTLQGKGYAFSDEIERAVADQSVAEANVLAAEEQQALDALEYEKAESLLEQRTIRSPIDGVVAEVHREEREYITVMNPVVLTVVQLDPLRVVFPVPTFTALTLRSDQQVTVQFPATGDQAVGRIELVSPITDAESGMVRVKVLLANPQGRYRCGVRCALSLGPASQTATATKP